MWNGLLFVLWLIACAASSMGAFATTWYVDKAGVSGVATIQEAVDLAASGDTVRVGPGFYDDVHELLPPWDFDLGVVQVIQEELTIIGAGANESIIGQQIDWEASQGIMRGIVGGIDCLGNRRLNIQGLGVEGVYGGIHFQGGGVLTVKDCRFQRNHTSIALYAPSFQSADSVFVQDSKFEPWDNILSSQHIWTNGQNFLSVRESSFQMQDVGITKHILFAGKDLFVEECQFTDGRAGIALSCEGAVIKNVRFDSQEFFGIQVNWGVVSVESCHIANTTAALYEDDYEGAVRWEVDGLTVSGVSESTLRYLSLGEGYIRNSILARGENYVVKYAFADKDGGGGDLPVFQMTDNWWGTTDPDSIRSRIFDGNDDVAAGVLIDFEPFKLEPLVGTEKTSLSGFKALFR